MKTSKLAILISSFDGAEDLWIPLEQTYEKFWADNPYKVYLSTNQKTPLLKTFNILNIGTEKSWSDNILKCLDLIEEEYILLTFDDLFLYKKINTELINKYVNRTISNEWDYLRLHPSPKADIYIDDYLGKIKQNRPYRASTVWSIINKKVFKDLLIDTESAWEFERNASIRSNKFEDFYVSNQIVIPYLNGVVKGKWIPSVMYHLKYEGFDILPDKRVKMTLLESFIEKLKRLRLKIFLNYIPKALQIKVRNSLDLFNKK